MKLGVFAVLFGDKSLDEALDYIAKSGLDAVEIGAGGFPGNSHCKPEELLADEDKLKQFKEAVESRGLQISAIS
jgi:sugar phosphate isomerase/epimerase